MIKAVRSGIRKFCKIVRIGMGMYAVLDSLVLLPSSRRVYGSRREIETSSNWDSTVLQTDDLTCHPTSYSLA
jgi:hypothetical protein